MTQLETQPKEIEKSPYKIESPATLAMREQVAQVGQGAKGYIKMAGLNPLKEALG